MIELYKKIHYALIIPVFFIILVSILSLSYSSFKSVGELDEFLRDTYINQEKNHLEKNILLFRGLAETEFAQNQQLNITMNNFFNKISNNNINYGQNLIGLENLNSQQRSQKIQQFFQHSSQIDPKNFQKNLLHWYQTPGNTDIFSVFNSENPSTENIIFKYLQQYITQLQINGILDGYSDKNKEKFIQQHKFGTVFRDIGNNEQYDNFNIFQAFFMQDKNEVEYYQKKIRENPMPKGCFFENYCYGKGGYSQYMVKNQLQQDYADIGFSIQKNIDSQLGIELFGSSYLGDLYRLLEEKYKENSMNFDDYDDKKLRDLILEEVIMFQNDQDKKIFLYYQDQYINKNKNLSSTVDSSENSSSNTESQDQNNQQQSTNNSTNTTKISYSTKKLQDYYKKKFEQYEGVPQKIIDQIEIMMKNAEENINNEEEKDVQSYQFFIHSSEDKKDEDEYNYYLYLIPIKQDKFIGNQGQEQQQKQTEIVGYVSILKQKKVLVFPFVTTFEKLNYIKYITFFVIFLLSCFIAFMAYRHSKKLAVSVFKQPLEDVKRILDLIDSNENDEQWDYDEYQTNFNCREIQVLIQSIVSLVKDIKFSNTLFSENDANSLLRLSKAKLRYNHSENLSGVGICCNNIGNIHLKNGRYSEAVSEYQESILMAKIEYKEYNKRLYNEFIQGSTLQEQYDQLKKIRKNKDYSDDSYQIQADQDQADFVYDPQFQFLKGPEQNMDEYDMADEFLKNGNGNGNINGNGHNNFLNIDNNNNLVESETQNGNNNYKEDQLDRMLLYKLPKCENLLFSRNQAKQNMLNRKYQLGVALYFYGSKEQDVNLLPQAIELFCQCLKITRTQKMNNRSNLVRRIMILQKQAFCYVKLLEINEAQKNLEHAKKHFKVLEKMQPREQENKPKDFLDIFDSIPNDVIEQHIMYTEALIQLLYCNFQTARHILTQIIKKHSKYDTGIRENSLKILKSLFIEFQGEDFGLIINKYLQKFNLKTIDIIFLIDYSKIMSDEQIRRAHHIARNVLDELQPNDKLGYVAFNDSVHEFFQLQYKKKYYDLLEKKVRTIMLAPGGSAQLYKALKETSKLFEKQHGLKMEQEEEEISKGVKGRYLVLISEGDFKWEDYEFQEIKRLFEKKQIRLLVTNISQQNQHMLYLQDLTTNIQNSEFFSADGKIPEFIQNLRERNTKQQLIYEYLS